MICLVGSGNRLLSGLAGSLLNSLVDGLVDGLADRLLNCLPDGKYGAWFGSLLSG